MDEREIMTWAMLIGFGVVGLIIWIINLVCQHKADKEMIAKGHTWEFVISCSADPGSWQWVKKP